LRNGEYADERESAMAAEVLGRIEGHEEADGVREAPDFEATDDRKTFLIQAQYGAYDAEKLGMGERLEFWIARTNRKGRETLFLCGVNPKTGYVASRFFLPAEFAPLVADYVGKRYGKGGDRDG